MGGSSVSPDRDGYTVNRQRIPVYHSIGCWVRAIVRLAAVTWSKRSWLERLGASAGAAPLALASLIRWAVRFAGIASRGCQRAGSLPPLP
jgi:hypothetical protein